MMDQFGISQPVRRREDIRFITGRGRYSDDIDVPGQVHVAFLRSDHAHGELRSVDTTRAAAAPGLLGVFTGEDLRAAGVGGIPYLHLPGFNLFPTETPRPGLAQGRVRYVGEPIAMVVAATSAQAQDAVAEIAVEIEPLPAIADIERAMEPDAPILWEKAPGNISLVWQSGDPAEIDQAFADAAHVTKLKLLNTRVVANPIEPRACIASYDAQNDRYQFITTSQGVRYMVRVLCDHVLKIPHDKMHVVTYDVGGAFGVKEQPYPEDVAVLHAARVLKRPVKWCATRNENILSDNHARDAVIECALALDTEGKFLAIRATILAAMGAYFACHGPHASVRNTTFGLPAVYRTPLSHVLVKGVMTNTAPIGPYRGAGREQAAYIVERLVDEAARQTGIDRIELRRRNLIPTSAIPYRTPSGRLYDSGDFKAVLDHALKASDWDGYPARAAASKAKGLLRGRGLSIFLECVGASPYEASDIRFTDDGRVLLVVATQSQGQGHETTFPQVVADRLGIAYDLIEVAQGDSDDVPEGFATVGSRSMIMAGSALARTCDIIIEKGRHAAAHLLETAEADIEYAQGEFRVVGTDRAIGLIELARRVKTLPSRPEGMAESLDSTGDYTAPDMHFPNGCHVCEIEIDPATGTIKIDRYLAVDDVGTVINPMVVHGQVHGGIAQGVGQALMEHCRYDEDAQMLTGTFMDYAMPRAVDVPRINAEFHPVPSPKNPLGVKGAGECGVTGSLAAVMNAIADVLAQVGAPTEIDMPATSEKIWRALQQVCANPATKSQN
jgi:aerobic carbon-monoxide dehydrogenase large subunit